jgi:Asp/Glu/hydantoin racemase
MEKRLLVINPNSSASVTRGIDHAIAPLRSSGPVIEVIGLAEGPPGIETQQHVESVVPLILNKIRERDDASGFVIACFSDPGLHAAREAAGHRPVFGIAECGILTALTLGARFGLISILPQVIPRHIRFLGAMGVLSRCAGDRAIGRKVTELANEGDTFAGMREVGATLRDQDGADVLVMACAGMAQYRGRLADALGIPVVEPSQAATNMALGRLALGW